MQRAGVPVPLAFNASMIGPVLAQFGSQEQKERFLPATANLDIWWSQGFSEPDAGSDLASLRTSAVRDGDEYVVNGQKTWTTLGQYGDWIFTLVRTTPEAEKKQAGISMLLIDMTTPGLTVRPIELIVDLAGPASAASGARDATDLPWWATHSVPVYLNFRKASIYGGSNEVQRQIIARTILGL
jgi:alkylation response protein AidB-like acyl-CoA dehydrogenase